MITCTLQDKVWVASDRLTYVTVHCPLKSTLLGGSGPDPWDLAHHTQMAGAQTVTQARRDLSPGSVGMVPGSSPPSLPVETQ